MLEKAWYGSVSHDHPKLRWAQRFKFFGNLDLTRYYMTQNDLIQQGYTCDRGVYLWARQKFL